MAKPKHGTLNMIDDTWYFYPGKSKEGVIIPDLVTNCQMLLDTLRNDVLCHVSAYGLWSLVAPTSLKHHQSMDPSDKLIWDQAYDEEYDALISIPTWEIISEAEFRQLSKGKRALPTRAIVTIKYDEHNKPKRAKYRLVVLGNMDYHTWSKED